MTLDESFRHRDLISKGPRARKVRTQAGVRFFKAPIGTPITRDMIDRAAERTSMGEAMRMAMKERDAKPTGHVRGSGKTVGEKKVAERKKYERGQSKKRKKYDKPDRSDNTNKGGPGYPGN